MSVRMRHTRSHTRNRRSHHAIEPVQLSTCANCEAKHVRHTACGECGQYRGRQVVDTAGRNARSEARARAKAKVRGIDPDAQASDE